MSTITKDLGVVTAYGYYKAGGGTMTESEFTQFMVDFGTASKTATEAAQAAAESAQASAARSADAQDSAEEARQSASIASTRAIEADTAAGASIDAKNDAITAKTAAETAQGKAEEAQAAAAQSASEAAESARTLTIDSVPAQGSTNAVSSGGVWDEIADLKEDLNPIVYDTATLTDGTTYVEIPYTIGQKVVIETISGENLASDCKVYAYDSEKTYLDKAIVSANTNKKEFTSTINAVFLRCSSAPSTPLKVTVIDESKLVYKFDFLSKDVEALEETSTIVFSMTDVYERKEISANSNMYESMTAEVANRARVKQEYIQEVPTGATSVHVDISADSLASGKYKVGWAFYTDNYAQIRNTVKGWYTASTSFDVTVPNDGKYFMLYFATNSASEITLDEIDIAKNSIVFNNSSIDYAKAMVNTPLSFLYADTNEKIEALEASITASGDNNYFIYSVNHRGYSLEAPENTIPAYILSKKHGFTYAECDVEFTSDEVAVLLHDSTINRTARNTDGTTISSTINIGDITYNQVLAYDFGIWKGSEWAGTPIPTFDEFILACKKLSLHPFIELKDSVNGTYWTDARIASVANSIKNVGMENNVSFISFAISALQKIAVHFPTARLGLGFEGTYSTENFNAFVSNAESLLSADREVIATVNYGSMTDELYSILTEAGIKPLVWTVNSSSVVLSLDETVIGVLSDSINAGEIILKDMLDSIS